MIMAIHERWARRQHRHVRRNCPDACTKQTTDNRDSLSGVNLDEEAAKLIQFEQYYNASAQIIQVARSLFDTLISTFR